MQIFNSITQPHPHSRGARTIFWRLRQRTVRNAFPSLCRVAVFGSLFAASFPAGMQAVTPVNDNTSKPYVSVYSGGLTGSGMYRDNYFATWLNRSQVWPTTFMSTTSGGNTWLWSDLEGFSDVLTGGRRWVNSHPGSNYVLSVGMLPGTGGAPSVRANDTVHGGLVSHARGARGDYDNHFQTLAQRIVNSGIADKTIIRLGWEFNGAWYPWFIDSSSAENAPILSMK